MSEHTITIHLPHDLDVQDLLDVATEIERGPEGNPDKRQGRGTTRACASLARQIRDYSDTLGGVRTIARSEPITIKEAREAPESPPRYTLAEVHQVAPAPILFVGEDVLHYTGRCAVARLKAGGRWYEHPIAEYQAAPLNRTEPQRRAPARWFNVNGNEIQVKP